MLKIKNLQTKHWNSSNVGQTEYFVEQKALNIYFSNGSVYQYMDVPIELWFDSCKAASIGSWMNRNLRGVFRYVRLA